MKKIVSIICVIVILTFAITCVSAAGSESNIAVYSNKYLKKLNNSIEPNVLLGETGTKNNANKSVKHEVDSVVDAGGNTVSINQAVKMWRSDGTQITKVLWHHTANTYSMGVGSSKLLTGYSYKVKARGNTDNPSAVYMSGSIDPDGGRNK